MRACLATVAAFALLLPASAGAHAFLVASTPANGASLPHAPRSIVLRFTEPVSASLSQVQVFDAHGKRLRGAGAVRGRTASELRLALPGLATGAYRIVYSTVSQDDLHRTGGSLVFGAGTAPPPSPALAPTTPGTSIAESIAHLVDLIALSVLIAICALLAGGLPPAVRSRVARFAVVALPALLVAGLLALADKASQLPLQAVFAHTAWGHAMLVRELAILAVVIAVATRRHRLALALLVPVAAAEAASGHAASLGASAIAAMTAHILAAGLWVGGLIVLACVLPGLERRDALAALARFGRLAAAGVAVLVVTGVYSAGRQVASVDALLSTTYGWSLVGKLALLGATGALGLLGLRAVRRGRPSPRLLRAEAVAAVGVLAAAALLLSSAPARGPQFAPAPASSAPRGSVLASGRARDLLVDISAAPNRPGQNFVTATILDTLRPSPGAGPPRRDDVLARCPARHGAGDPPGCDALAGCGHTALGGRLLDDRDRGRAQRPAARHLRLAVDRRVAPQPRPSQPARYSQRPLQPILTALALALAALTGLSLALARIRQASATTTPDCMMRSLLLVALAGAALAAVPAWQLRRPRR